MNTSKSLDLLSVFDETRDRLEESLLIDRRGDRQLPNLF